MTRAEAIKRAEDWVRRTAGPPGGPFNLTVAGALLEDLMNTEVEGKEDEGDLIRVFLQSTIIRQSFPVWEAEGLLRDLKKSRSSTPTPLPVSVSDSYVVMIDKHGGRILSRDELAAAALTGIVSGRRQDLRRANPEEAAEWSYRFADAMKRARCRTSED